MSLPEKELFTLEEVIARWRFAGCDQATMLDYARRDLLVFSVYLRNLGAYEKSEETGDGRVVTTTTTQLEFRSPTYEWKPIRYLASEDARRVLECQSGEKVAVSVLYDSAARESSGGTAYMHAKYFKVVDLLVTKAERERFEAEHKINLASGRVARAWGWLSDSTNQKALAILGSAITAIAVAAWTVYVWWFPKAGTP